MKKLKRAFKRNTHNFVFKGLAGFGRSMNRLYENRNHDHYSNGELTVIKKLVRFNPTCIIDGGANIGKYSMLLQQYLPQCKVYAFEPVKSTYEELANQIKPYTNIEAINKGFFSETCTKEIHLFDSNTHSSLYDIKGISYHSTDAVKIDLIRGDEFIHERKIDKVDLLKLDLEGAEFDAIKGFETCFKNKQIRAVQFEYGYINISTKHLLIDYYAMFEANGYLLGKIFPKTVEFRAYKFKHEDFLGPNFIAVNKDEKDLIEALKKK